MICRNCKNEVEDGAKNCPFCGADLEVAEAQANAMEDLKNSDTVKKLPLACAAAVLVIIGLIWLLTHIGGGGVKGVAKDYCKYLKSGNGKKLVNMWLPKKVQEDYFDEKYDMSVKEMREEIDDGLDEIWDEMKDEKIKISFDIKGKESLDKLDDYDKKSSYEDLDEFKDKLEDLYDDYGFDAGKVKKAYIVEIETTLKHKSDKVTGKSYIYVYKYKGDWYVFGNPATNASNIITGGMLGGMDDLDFDF